MNDACQDRHLSLPYLHGIWKPRTDFNLHTSYLYLTSMAYWQHILCVAALLYAVGVLTLEQVTLTEDSEQSLQQVCGFISPSYISWS